MSVAKPVGGFGAAGASGGGSGGGAPGKNMFAAKRLEAVITKTEKTATRRRALNRARRRRGAG
jgi:hypothetical protein